MSEQTREDQRIVIAGAGGFGREVRDLVTDCGLLVHGFLDDQPRPEPALHAPVLGPPDHTDDTEVPFVVAIGAPAVKRAVAERVIASGRRAAAPIVHPSVLIGRDVTVGEGTLITAGNIITTNIFIGRHVIINLACTVGHDAVIGDWTSMMPGVHISGAANIGEGVFIGTNAVVLEGVSVGDGAVIGAGAVVNRALPPNVTAVGVPARPIG